MPKLIAKIWRENKSFFLFILLSFVFRSSIADWNDVPSGSMQPTILEGDRIVVNKLAYDLRVPFTHLSILKISNPLRGDIVVFDSKISDKRLVKRVVGVPGDLVELKENILNINGISLSYEDVAVTATITDRFEDLLGTRHQVRVLNNSSALSSFPPVKVPAGHYLVLGDNRDNSADSRVIGMVPRHEIVGRTKRVVMSLDYDNYYRPRVDRFLHML